MYVYVRVRTYCVCESFVGLSLSLSLSLMSMENFSFNAFSIFRSETNAYSLIAFFRFIVLLSFPIPEIKIEKTYKKLRQTSIKTISKYGKSIF